MDRQLRKSVLFILFMLALTSCDDTPAPGTLDVDMGVEALRAHSSEFSKKEVIEVTEGLHVAVGYGLANSILIEGEGGNIVVDTMGSLESAREVRAAFEKVSDAPIVAVIYTHFHPDHTLGAGAFVDDETVDVIAHEDTGPAIYKLVTVVRPIITTRSMRMFGRYLGDASVYNNGIGPTLDIGPERAFGIVPPGRTFSDRLELEIAGVPLLLEHAPGETDDQLFVWLPEHRAVLAGDNFYKAFPNLYTIRGTTYRDVMKWAESIDEMRAFEPDHLVPSHTRPISGADAVERALRDYRDAIQFVHDQTIRQMNLGKTPVEIAKVVELPKHLASSPYLQPLYGRVDWSIRSVYNGYLGWFDGNPTHLDPLTLAEEGARIAELAGGWDKLRVAARAAQEEGDHAWVLKLTDYLLAHDADDREAEKIRIETLKHLGTRAVNPNARHYYLTRALELRDDFRAGFDSKPTEEAIGQLPVESFVRALPVNLVPERSVDEHQAIVLRFDDVGQSFAVEVRRGIAIVKAGDQPSVEPEADVTMNSMTFKKLLAGLDSAAGFMVSAEMEFAIGGRTDLASFLRMFGAEPGSEL